MNEGFLDTKGALTSYIDAVQILLAQRLLCFAVAVALCWVFRLAVFVGSRVCFAVTVALC